MLIEQNQDPINSSGGSQLKRSLLLKESQIAHEYTKPFTQSKHNTPQTETTLEPVYIDLPEMKEIAWKQRQGIPFNPLSDTFIV